MACQNDRNVAAGKDGGADLDHTPDDIPEIDWHPWLGDQVCGGFIEAARRGDEAIEAIERALDNPEGALRALIVWRQGATQWFDRLANNRDRCLERVGI